MLEEDETEMDELNKKMREILEEKVKEVDPE